MGKTIKLSCLVLILLLIFGAFLYAKNQLKVKLSEEKDLEGTYRTALNEATAVENVGTEEKKRLARTEYGYVDINGIYFNITNPEELYGE